MKLSFLFCLLLLFSPFTYAFHVVIDPGHGGNDGGAKTGKVKESKLVLSISKKLQSLLDSDPSFRSSMTRETDRYISLKDRAELAENLKADVFVSIHANSSSDHKAQGKEIYFQNQLPPDEEALFLASQENKSHPNEPTISEKTYSSDVIAILEDLKRNHRIFMSGKLSEYVEQNWLAAGAKRKRPIRQAPFHVISNVSMPSVLIETGYVTHKKEAKRLTDPAHQEKIARGIYLGLKEFKDFMDRETHPHLN